MLRTSDRYRIQTILGVASAVGESPRSVRRYSVAHVPGSVWCSAVAVLGTGLQVSRVSAPHLYYIVALSTARQDGSDCTRSMGAWLSMPCLSLPLSILCVRG